jgi:hypothetical protein
MKIRILSIVFITVLFAFPQGANATIKWANNATSLVADVGGIDSLDTSVTVTTGEGDKFPAVASPHYFMITLVDVSGNREIVKVTARTAGSNTMTIVRAQEGTSAREFAQGSYVDQRITAGSLDEFSRAVDVFENYYVCDASAADQADTVNDNSLASLTGDIGTSLNATIVLPHSGTGSTTAYNVLQNLDLSSYDNITYIIERGAIITHAANTIDMATPQAGAYQIFNGTGTVTFNVASPGRPTLPQWWGAKSGGAAATNVAAINAALVAGKDIYLAAGTYQTNGTIDVPSYTHFRGAGMYKTQIAYTGTGAVVKMWDDSVGIQFSRITDMWIENPEATGTPVAGQYGIHTLGTSQSCSIERVRIRRGNDTGLYIEGWSNGLLIDRCRISGLSDGWGIQILYDGVHETTNTIIRDCQITSNKGCIYTEDVLLTQVLGGTIGSVSTTPATNGTIHFNNEFKGVIRDVRSEMSEPSTSGIILEDSNKCLVEHNYFSHQETAHNSIAIEFIGNASENVVQHNRFTLSGSATGTNIAIDMDALTVTDEPNQINQMIDSFDSDWTTFINDTHDNVEFRLPGAKFGLWGANHQYLNISQKTTELTSMSGATITWSNAIPAGSMVFGISARVTTLVTGATTMDIGESGGDTDLYIDGMAVAADTTADIANSNAALTGPKAYQSTTSILVTAVGGAANFSAGALRLTLYYIELTPPTN